MAVGNRRQQRNRFESDIRAAREQLAAFDEAKAAHRVLLGGYAVGDVPKGQIDAQRKRMADLDAQAAELRQDIEVAEAGIDHMDRALAPMHALIAQAQQELKRLERAARIEMAESYVPAYIAAAQAFADAHAALTGACLLVDEGAESHEQWVRGVLFQEALTVPLPSLPSVAPPFSHTFDLKFATESARIEAGVKFLASVA